MSEQINDIIDTEQVRAVSEHYKSRADTLAKIGELATVDQNTQNAWDYKYPHISDKRNGFSHTELDSDFNILANKGLTGPVVEATKATLDASSRHYERNEEAYRLTAAEDALESGILVNTPEARELGASKVANTFHESWRQTRRNEDGSFEPRVKPTTDEDWSAAHDGTTEVDIANTSFEDLPADWQAENKAAADVVVGLLAEANGKIDLSSEEDVIAVGTVIHDAWLARNEWAKGGELDKPFAELSEEEQAKDIDQMSIAIEVLGQ